MHKSLAQITRSSSALLSQYIQSICDSSLNSHRPHLQRVFYDIISPSIEGQRHYHKRSSGKIHTISVPYHDHREMEISDYFSAIGYILSFQGSSHETLSFTQIIKLASQYAEWCRTSATILKTNPPTVVQLLWVASEKFRYPSSSDWSIPGRFSLASSVSAGKLGGRREVRECRVNNLKEVWSHSLPLPTPVQREHANGGIIKFDNTSAELFGTPWGHCGEFVSFAAMHKMIHMGIPLGTLALSVKSITSVIPGTDVVPVQTIPDLQHLKDIVEILRQSGSMRPMCLNCQYLRSGASGRIDDYAAKFAVPQIEGAY